MHSAIQDAAVIGIEDETYGELPGAVIVREPDTQITEDEIKDYVACKYMEEDMHVHCNVKFTTLSIAAPRSYRLSVTFIEFNCVSISGQVSPYKRLSGGVWFVNFIPKTTTGKINRRELRKSIDMLS